MLRLRSRFVRNLILKFGAQHGSIIFSRIPAPLLTEVKLHIANTLTSYEGKHYDEIYMSRKNHTTFGKR